MNSEQSMSTTSGRRQINYKGCPKVTVASGWWREIGLVWLVLAAAIVLPAQDEQPSPDTVTFKTLVKFNGTNGGNPIASLVQGTDGNLYGTTALGNGNLANGGNVFRMTPGGSISVLYSFCAKPNCADGSIPTGLTLGTDGNLYGTTLLGGTNAGGSGTFFKITPAGTLTTLYNFCGLTNCTDGSNPENFGAALVIGADGDFYGTTLNGGLGSGTVFKITPKGTLATLYKFCSLANCADGGFPNSSLIQATDGDFYGTTNNGGASGVGTVFKITPKGSLTTVHSACSQPNCVDGDLIDVGNQALVQAANGHLYGVMEACGANAAYGGTIFEITPTVPFTTLYSFCAQPNCADGVAPTGSLVQAADGNFYGATYNGALNTCGYFGGCGTLFKITPGGTLTSLHQFYGTDGEQPYAALVQATNGTFYGTTSEGGISNPACAGQTVAPGCGTVFSLSVGLGPFVELLPTSGKVGALVKILGNNLTSTTSVSFNGTAAAFKVVSATEIETKVPTGATTGFVTVTTSTRTLKSNVKFRVR